MNFSNSGKFMGSYEVKHQEHQKAHLQTKDDGTKLLPHVSSFNKTRVCLELVWIRPRSPAALGNAIPGRPLWRALRIRPHSPAALGNAVPGRPLWRALRKVPLLGTTLQTGRGSLMIGKVWTKWPALYLGDTVA